MRHTKFMISVAAVALAGAGAGPAIAAPWVKGYVVGQYEYAFRYGGRSDFTRGAEIEPAAFTSRAGGKGIDTNLYRAWGCDAPWRGNGNATLEWRANDKMPEGL